MVAFNKLSQYGLGFQVKILNSLLKNKKFILTIRDTITPDYFDSQAHQWIIKTTLSYFDKYHATPTLETLQVEVKKIENDVLKTTVVEQLKETFKVANDDNEYVEEEFSNFCKNQQLKSALLQSVDLLQSGMYDDIRTIVDNALKAGQDKNIGHEYNKDIETRYRDEVRGTVPTPWDLVNDLLSGGLGNGDFGLIFGNPGGGKSWTLVALGAWAVRLGYNVVHYTLELSEGYVGKRYDAYFANKAVNVISSFRADVEKAIAELPGTLTIKEYPPGKATITTIQSHIQKLTDLDNKPDLVLIDYVDLLRSKRNSKERKEEIDDIYLATKGLARELNVPIWSVSQVNRAGAKDDVIEGDKAAGSYDKIMITDFAMSLSRKRQDKVNGTGRFHIMKNRYGMDGSTYFAKIDTSTGHIELDEEPMDEDGMDNPSSRPTNTPFNGGVSTDEKKHLSNFLKLKMES
jgi:replicative DNA helicase